MDENHNATTARNQFFRLAEHDIGVIDREVNGRRGHEQQMKPI